jgi:hypothetical protein
MKTITVDNALTILSIIGEEDSIGFENDKEVQDAIEKIQTKIEAEIRNGSLDRNDVILTFI